MLVGQTKRLDQIPGEPRLRIKITEHLEGLIGIVDNFVQSRLVHSSCFEVLTTSRLNLAVSSKKRFRTRTVVPNAGGLTDLIAGSSIQTRIAPAAAISAREVTNTGRDTAVLLVEKRSIKISCLTNISNNHQDKTFLGVCFYMTKSSVPFTRLNFLYLLHD